MKLISLILVLFATIGIKCAALDHADTVIFWDLHGTLVRTSKLSAFWHVGLPMLSGLVDHAFDHKERRSFGDKIQDFYLETLALIPSPANTKTDYQMCDPHGHVLPTLLCDFMLGTVTYEQASEAIKKWLKNNRNYFAKFASKSENEKDERDGKKKGHKQRRLFKRIAHLNFDPQTYVSTLKTTACTSLLRKCFQATDKNGHRKNVCVILSNWAQEWIEPFTDKFKTKIMNYMDGALFSGQEHCAKPGKDILKKCCAIASGKRKILIDDQKENRAAAQATGMITFDPEEASAGLRKIGVIE